MNTINEVYEYSQTIKKSEFICTLIPVNSLDKVNEALRNIRKKYYDATHNCYSYIVCDSEGVEHIKASDDGEPSQTAGVVILDVLKKKELTNVLAVVTRYFGGIKLGAGGLVRAYSSSTSEACKIANIVPIIKYSNVKLSFAYEYTNDVLKECKDYEVIDQSFTTFVSYTYVVPESSVTSLKEKLVNLTKNSIAIEIINK